MRAHHTVYGVGDRVGAVAIGSLIGWTQVFVEDTVPINILPQPAVRPIASRDRDPASYDHCLLAGLPKSVQPFQHRQGRSALLAPPPPQSYA